MRLQTQASKTAGSGGLAVAGNKIWARASVVISVLDAPGVASCATAGATPSTRGRPKRRVNNRSHRRYTGISLKSDGSMARHPTGCEGDLSLYGSSCMEPGTNARPSVSASAGPQFAHYAALTREAILC